MAPIPASNVARASFRLIARSRCNEIFDVTRYRSEKTGLRITIADIPGPIIGGHICLATEANNDDGLPHTLEHLVFMGSKKYPYKGLLDLVANRCLASGTNAWTATDHTNYTLTTAGSQGFLIMLPVYVDHVFRPLLTEAQYVTEVHHINGRGEDGGVVYCEMQEHESDMDWMVERAFMERMYRGSGYAVETGGRLLNLRTSTSHEKVQSFHGRYYDPGNCELIVTGKVEHEKIFAALVEFETIISEERQKDDVSKRPRPWTSPIPRLTSTEVVTLVCPADDEKSGVVVIGWRGPNAKDYRQIVALGCLMEYLTESAVSPFERDFIQLADPYCSGVGGSLEENVECCLKIEFEGVELGRLKEIRPRLLDTMRKIGSEEDPFDARRMDDLLRQSMLRTASAMETDAHEKLGNLVIKDFLHGASVDDFALRLDLISILRDLRRETKDYWLTLFREYLGENIPHVCVIGEPSLKEVKKLTQTERERVRKQREQLGKQGLRECEIRLKAAMKENEKNTPSAEVMEKLMVNSLDGIEFFTLRSFSNRNQPSATSKDANSKLSLDKVPFTTLLDDFSGTKFAQFTVQLDTSEVEDDLKPLLMIWSNLLFESPIIRNGELVPYEEVVKELERDLVSYSCGPGVAGSFYRVLSLEISVDVERFGVAIEWINRILYDVKFDPDRIRVLAKRLINSAAEWKRSGDYVAKFLRNHLCYAEKTQPHVYELIRLEKYLAGVLKRLEDGNLEIVERLKKLQENLTARNRMVVYLLCETEKLKKDGGSPDASSLLSTIIPERFIGKTERAEILGEQEPRYLNPDSSFGRGVICSVGSCESCHLYQSYRIQIAYTDPELPALKLLIQYLCQCEGPLFREIRGNGLAYGVGINLSIDKGLMKFSLYRTTDVVAAYRKSKRVVEDFCLRDRAIDADEFEAAKRSLVFEIINTESTISEAGAQSLLSYYRGVPADYNRRLIERLWAVEVGQLRDVGRKYISPLFEWSKVNTAITCHPSNLDDVVGGFKEIDRDLRVVKLDDDEFSVL